MRQPKPAATPPITDRELPAQLALRETQAFVFRPRFWVVLAGVALAAALAGPFNTLARMGFGARLFYFGLIVACAAVMMSGLATLFLRLDPRARLHWAPVAVVIALLGLFPLMAVVYLANFLTTGDGSADGYLNLLPYVAGPLVVINLIVTGVLSTARAPGAAPAPVVETAPNVETAPEPLLFDKVPPALGREIVTLEAQDHYIEVTTPQGRAQVLMRMSDAERDLAALSGLRVHRSWWLNLDHVDRVERGATGKVNAITLDGRAVPVSRSQQAVLRTALAERQQARPPPHANP